MVKKKLGKTWMEYSFAHGIYLHVGQMHLFNVHLDDVSPSNRKKQLDQIPLHDKKYVILGGDFNQQYKKDSRLPGFTVHNQCCSYFVEKT
jgi:endonuclease/exonuclease/phosphatase family metal-dependent hydrolase